MAAVASPPLPAHIPFCRTKHLACPKPGCPKTYNRPALLEQHLRSHTNDRPFACPHNPCPKTFTRQAHLTRHVQSAHDNVRTYACDFAGCGKAFATGTRLRRHRTSHEKREKHRCGEDGCGKSFRKAATLAKHRVTVHEGKAAFACEEIMGEGVPCGKEFNDAYRLKLHRETNHTPGRFSCAICKDSRDGEGQRDMYFAAYNELQAHNKEVHPPTCSECGHVCRCPSDLAQHFNARHNPKPPPREVEVHRCTEEGCEAGFERNSSLINHVKNVHSTSRPFACNSADPSTLRRIGEWNGTDACEQSFKTKARLEKHIRKVHLGLDAKRLASAQSDAGPEPLRKRRKRGGASAVDLLTGSATSCIVPGCSSCFTGDADLSQHLQTRHGLAAAEIRRLQEGSLDHEDDGDDSDLEAQEALDALEWDRSLELAATSGGAFWLGDYPNEEDDDWDEDEMEIQRLVGGQEMEGELPVDPALK